jgi:asparagine synthase (glutamine-hydrolysing)
MYLNNNTQPLLPESILWRRKEAFSDGVSKTTRSLYEIIQEYCEKNKDSLSLINPSDFCWNTPKTIEQIWYRSLFESYYPGMGESIPYFWLPKYVNATDASARTLEIYNSTPNGAPRHK